MLKTVGRAIELLSVSGVSPHGLSLSELAREMRVNKQAVFRLAKTLAAFHFVAQNPSNGKLRLGAGLLRLADTIRPELDLRQIALPALTRLRISLARRLAFTPCSAPISACAYFKWKATMRSVGRPKSGGHFL